jgi:hypothetical protein
MLARCDHAAKQTSPRDGTARNVHRKKDIPGQARSIPPEKHSTSNARPCGSPPLPKPRHILNRDCGNAPPIPLATISENL